MFERLQDVKVLEAKILSPSSIIVLFVQQAMTSIQPLLLEIQVYGLANLNNCFCLYWLVSSRSSESLIPARSVRGLMDFASEQVHNLKVHYPSQAIFMEGDIHCDSFRTWHSRKGLAKASPSARCCHLTAPRGLNKDNLGLETRTHTQMYVLLYILLYIYYCIYIICMYTVYMNRARSRSALTGIHWPLLRPEL